MFYNLLSYVGFTICVLLVISFVVYIPTSNWTTLEDILANVVTILMFICLVVAMWIVSRILGRSSKEVSEIHDRNLLVSLTSSLVGFLALVIAVVAIFLK